MSSLGTLQLCCCIVHLIVKEVVYILLLWYSSIIDFSLVTLRCNLV